MSTDDTRMHGGNTPGLVPGRGHERHEEPVRTDGTREPGEAAPNLDGPTEDLLRDRDESARSGTIATDNRDAAL